jgi:hypothetical protein
MASCTLAPFLFVRPDMPFLLSDAVDADFDRLIEIQFAAFGQTGDSPREPFMDWMYPNADTPSGQAAARDRTLKSLRSDHTATFLKVTDTDTGEIVGGAKWNVYEKKPEQKRVEVNSFKGEEREYAELVLGVFHRRRHEHVTADGPYLCESLVLSRLSFDRYRADANPMRTSNQS